MYEPVNIKQIRPTSLPTRQVYSFFLILPYKLHRAEVSVITILLLFRLSMCILFAKFHKAQNSEYADESPSKKHLLALLKKICILKLRIMD